MANNHENIESLRLVTLSRASEQTGICVNSFRNLIRSKKLKPHKVNKSILISLTEFERLAKGEEV